MRKRSPRKSTRLSAEQREDELDGLLDRIVNLRRAVKHPEVSAEKGLPFGHDDLEEFLDLAECCLDELGKGESAGRIENIHALIRTLRARSDDAVLAGEAAKDAHRVAEDGIRHARIACVDLADAELRNAKLDLVRHRVSMLKPTPHTGSRKSARARSRRVQRAIRAW